MLKDLERAQGYLLGGLLFLLPLFFLPVTSDFFDFNKLVLLVLGVFAALIVWSLASMRDFKLRLTPVDLPLFIFAGVFVASSFVVTPYKINAFVFPGETTLIVAATFLYFLIVQYVRNEQKAQEISLWLLGGGAVAGLVAVLSAVGVWGFLSSYMSLPVWLNQNTFSTLGLPLATLVLLIVLLPMAVGKVVSKEKRGVGALLPFLFTVLIVAGLAATAYYLLPGKPASPVLLPFSSGWSIALEAIKKSPMLGMGPGNFVEAFNRYRPVEYNLTDVWAVRFTTSSDWYLHVFTITGILGIAALGLTLWMLWKKVFPQVPTSLTFEKVGLILTLVLFLIIPAPFILVVVFYTLLALVAGTQAKEFKIALSASGSTSREINLFPGFIAALSLVGLILTFVYGRGVYAGEVVYRSAINAFAANDGQTAYNNLIQSISYNSRVPRYHADFAQLSLIFANNIAQNKELTDEQRTAISRFVQQSIEQSKASVTLGQNRAENWENLARIYQTLIASAEGADQFAIATYRQAIALDPVNPNLRIALGGLYYSLGKYDEAVRTFELAVASKPNLANAHYNLAAALREKKDTQSAIAEMEQVLQLVDANSQDYKTAQEELDKLRGKLKEEQESTRSASSGQAQQAEGTLQAPQQPSGPVIQPPLELPAGSEPPAVPGSEDSSQQQ